MARKLFEIVSDGLTQLSENERNTSVLGLTQDSRTVEEGFVYVAIVGSVADGHQYIDKAIGNGAKVIVHSTKVEKSDGVIYLRVEDTRAAMASMASSFYNCPAQDLKLVGITGTNGKTTVSTLCWQLFKSLGYKVGLISTVENRVDEEVVPATHTTPDVITLNKLLRTMADAGCEYVFMEVSSHAVHQGRIAGVDFAGAAFTNISHDHLDYHKTFKNYINAKKKFFDDIDNHAFAIANADDKNGAVMLQNTAAKKRFYGLKTMADFKAKIISNSIHGLHLLIDGTESIFRLVGEFNAYNLLLVYAIARELGFDASEILVHLSNLKGAEGRFELVTTKETQKVGIVDYAHTPDALENVLRTIDKVKTEDAKVFTIVGAGGDRDASKRPKMAAIAAKLSDQVILTSDNPRTENPETILDDMEDGLAKEDFKRLLRITDRKQAVKTAVRLAGEKDIILLAGKGHEKYQDINGVKTPFDDKEVLLEALKESST